MGDCSLVDRSTATTHEKIKIHILYIYILHTKSGIVHFAIITVIFIHIANVIMLLYKKARF